MKSLKGSVSKNLGTPNYAKNTNSRDNALGMRVSKI